MRPRFAEEDEDMLPYHLRGGGMKRKKDKARDEESLLEMFGAASSGGATADSAFGFISGGGLQDQQRQPEPAKVPANPVNKKTKRKKKKLAASPQEERAAWEHGLGRKLLKGMGWKGRGGLGAEGKGITQAIDVVVRPAFAGLRDQDEKSNTILQMERERDGYDDEEEEDDQVEELLSQANKWRRIKVPQAQSKVVYKTAAQLLEESDSTAVKVVDLTGAPVVQFRPTTHDQGPLRELRFNVSRMVDGVELELRATNQKLKGAQRRYDTFSGQLASLEETVAEDDAMAQQLEQLSALLIRLESQSAAMAQVGSPEELTPRLTGIFQSISSKYPKLYSAHDLRGCLLSLLIPTLKPFFQEWDFSSQPDRGAFMMPALLEALGVRWYSQLVWQLVLPPIQTFTFATWEAKRQPYALLGALRAWQAHFPPRTLNHILWQFVVPRLRREALEWRPSEDLLAPQTWIEPWVPLIGDALETEVYPSLVATLGVALRAGWDVRDMTLLALIETWPSLISSHLLQPVTSAHILPELTRFAAKWDPGNPEDLAFLLAWNRWIKFEHFFSRRVFPQMARHLYTWVTSANPPEASKLRSWYESVKRAFPPDSMTPSIRTMVAHLLDIINNVLLEDQRHFQPDLVPATVVLDRKKSEQKRKVTTVQDSVSFKQMVETFAAQNNVIFMPTSRMSAQGHKLHSFGGKLVRLHDNVVYTEDGQPTSLQALLNNLNF